MSKQTLAHNINALGQTLAERHELLFVVLFGSVANDTAREGSDIDIAALRKDHTPLSRNHFFEIIDECSKILTGSFSKIDLVDLATANILLRYEITSGGVVLYGDSETYENYRIFALRDYRDSDSLRHLEEELIEKRQHELHTRIHVDQRLS